MVLGEGLTLNKGVRKGIYVSILILVVGCVYLFNYFRQYNIENERTAIESVLKEWVYDDSEFNGLRTADLVQIDNTNSYMLLFQLENGNVGYAHLMKGWNDKFKMNSSGYGTNITSYKTIKTNHGKYAISYGKNPGLKIDHIKVDLYYEDFSFTADVSSEDLYLKYVQLPKNLKKTFPAELTYYDQDAREINPFK